MSGRGEVLVGAGDDAASLGAADGVDVELGTAAAVVSGVGSGIAGVGPVLGSLISD